MDIENAMKDALEGKIITNTPRPGDKPGSRDRVKTEDLLIERSKTHGDYSVHARITQRLKAIILDEGLGIAEIGTNSKLNEMQRESLDMIFHKIGRILAGDPDFRDHWDDIAGYAKLVADRCSK